MNHSKLPTKVKSWFASPRGRKVSGSSASIIGLLALIVGFQNCTGQGFNVSSAAGGSQFSLGAPALGSGSTLPSTTGGSSSSNTGGSSSSGSGGSAGSSTGGSSTPLSSGDFVVVAPGANSRVSGTIAITGTAGADVANVAAYSASGQKIAADMTPVDGGYRLSFNTEQLDNGSTVISVIGFTTGAGQSGGDKLIVYLPLDIENADKPAGGGSPSAGSSGSNAGPVTAVSANTFLSSLGINIHHAQGVPIDSYVQALKYLGVRNVRDDYANPSDFISLHQQTGVLLNMILKNNDLPGTLAAGRALASAGAFLSFEGANEPNNFPITYQGQSGGSSGSWTAVAQYQTDLYTAVHADSQLQNFPVFSPTEAGAETNNVGLQFLTIPQGAGTEFPAGTHFADYANIHNYVSSTQAGFYMDNQAWKAADPTLNAQWDALYVEFGKTWLKGYAGYTNDQLAALPRVTTETGWDSGSDAGGEQTQATVLLNAYLAQFKRGFRYTFIYMLRDGEGGGGHQGVYNGDSSPKLAATYIHNLTSILADTASNASLQSLGYTIANQPSTVHDLLLQKADGTLELVVWDEKVSGQDSITVSLGATASQVSVYDPTTGTSAIKTYQGVNAVPLTLSNHPQIIEFKK